MLHKEDIIRILRDLNLSEKEYWVSSGAGLVLHGVKASTNDIDLGCTTSLAEYFIQKGCKYKTDNAHTRIVEVNAYVELIENWFADEIQYIENFPVATLESIKKQKAKLGREKDLRDIQLIDEYLKEKIFFNMK